jgi:hypothetical protein
MEIISENIIQYVPHVQILFEILKEHKEILLDLNNRILQSVQANKGVELTFNRLVIVLRFIWEAMAEHDMLAISEKLKELFPVLKEIPIYKIYSENIPVDMQEKLWFLVDTIQQKVDIEKIYKNIPHLNTNIGEFLGHIECAKTSLLSLCINLL